MRVRPSFKCAALGGGLALAAVLAGGLVFGFQGHLHLLDEIGVFHSHAHLGTHHHEDLHHEHPHGEHPAHSHPHSPGSSEGEREPGSDCNFVGLVVASLEARVVGQAASPLLDAGASATLSTLFSPYEPPLPSTARGPPAPVFRLHDV